MYTRDWIIFRITKVQEENMVKDSITSNIINLYWLVPDIWHYWHQTYYNGTSHQTRWDQNAFVWCIFEMSLCVICESLVLLAMSCLFRKWLIIYQLIVTIGHVDILIQMMLEKTIHCFWNMQYSVVS